MIFHPKDDYLADIRPLQRYIESELNVRDIVFSSDEGLAGVRYRAVADWPVLGKKLRKDVARVKKALPDISSDVVREYVSTGRMDVDGIMLETGDLTVQRFLELPAGSENLYGTHTDNDVVVRLDIQVHPELQGEWLAREFINRVQKLRKKAGLQATDDIDVLYEFREGEGSELLDSIQSYVDLIRKTTGSVPADRNEHQGGQVLAFEEQEIAEVKFILHLVRL